MHSKSQYTDTSVQSEFPDRLGGISSLPLQFTGKMCQSAASVSRIDLCQIIDPSLTAALQSQQIPCNTSLLPQLLFPSFFVIFLNLACFCWSLRDKWKLNYQLQESNAWTGMDEHGEMWAGKVWQTLSATVQLLFFQLLPLLQANVQLWLLQPNNR